MNKRLILLILALPLILMLSLFTTANSVSIAIQVPVTGLEIILEGGNPMVYVNLDDEDGGKYTIDYVVYPTNATNKEVDVYFVKEILFQMNKEQKNVKHVQLDMK